MYYLIQRNPGVEINTAVTLNEKAVQPTAALNESQKKSAITPSPKALAPKPDVSEVQHELDPEVKKIRAQAKMSLASAYAGLRAFHSEAKRYTTDLKAMGWQPSTPGMTFKMGFMAPYWPEKPYESDNIRELPDELSTDFFVGQYHENDSDVSYEYDSQAEKIDFSQFKKYCENGCTAGPETFEVLLIAPLPGKNTFDVWLINQDKEFKLVKDGLQPTTAL